MSPIIFLFAVLTSTVSCLPRDDVNYRLPQIYLPTNYELYLNLSEADFTESGTNYSGRVDIRFTVLRTTTEIKLHASHKDLQINSIMISGISIDELDYSIDEVTDILTISYVVGISIGEYNVLTIDFTGNLSEDMDGFYKSTYKDDSGTTRYLATTQFETSSARRAFPCFDEPSFKATFNISITYPLGYHAIGNTPGVISSSDSVSETIQFERTPRMSTYLLAFVISDFTCDKSGPDDGVPHQVCSRNNTSTTRGWALEMGPKMLAALDNFTGYAYSNFMTKLDQGAIPDFAAGAMENWGLVLYREGALLWDSEEGSNSEKQGIATTIAHEFSHQWFGDFLTLQWWSATFLNEGFATYCEFYIAHEVIPEWQLDVQFLVSVFQPVLIEDSYQGEQALVSQADTPEEISGKFGAISYSKGGSILRMLHHVLGKDTFIAGVRNYVDRNKFRNVSPLDLLNSLDGRIDDSQLPVPFIVFMENWIWRAGFPLVKVAKTGSRLTLTQERFLFNSGATDNTKWYIPISYTTSVDEDKFSETSPTDWLPANADLTIVLPENTTWVIINNQQTGYYRVHYDDVLWTYIIEALQKEDFDGIEELNRAQIVDDLFNLARAGKIEYSKVLDAVEFLANDVSYVTWKSAFNGFDYLLWIADPDLKEAVSSQILRLMTALYESSPASQPDPSDQIYTLKRVMAVTYACQLGNQDCVDYSLSNFATYKNNGAKLDTNLKYVIYCNALRYSTDPSDLEFIKSLYDNATAAEQWYLAGVLACSPDEEVLDVMEGYLHKILIEDSGVRSQDVTSAFAAVYKQNPKGVDVVYRFLMDNYNSLAQKYRGLNAPGTVLKALATKFSTQEQADKLKNAIEDGSLPKGLLSAAKSALEIAVTNIKWKEAFEDDVKDYYGLKY